MTKPFLFDLMALKAVIKALGVDQSPHFYVAYSGGIDSQVLLHHLYRFKIEHDSDLSITAIHINHQLNESARNWSEACQRQCMQWKIPFHTITIDIEGKNIESDARKKRYQALAQWIKSPNDFLLTGHHEQDQVETFFLNMMRGSGIDGLSAMPHVHQFHKGFKARPLLWTPKKDIIQYAQNHRLIWIDDPSNQDNYFSRNHVRNKIIPAFNQRWPYHQTTVMRSIQHIQDSKRLLDFYANEDLMRCMDEKKRLNIHHMQSWHASRIQLILRAWIKHHHKQPPGAKRLKQFHQLFQAHRQKQPEIACLNYCIRRYRDHLYLVEMRTKAKDENKSIIWEDMHEDLMLPELNQALVTSRSPFGLRPPTANEIVTVGFEPKHQQTFKPAGSLYHRKIKHLFQSWSIPPWERKYIPCIYYNHQLVAIVPYAIAHDFSTHCPKDEPLAITCKEVPSTNTQI